MASTAQASRRAGGQSTQSGGTRLPSSRERRPLLAVLAVLLIVGGAAAAGIVALRLADRTEYAYLGVDLGRGQEVKSGDLRIISLTADEVPPQGSGVSGPHLVTVEEANDYLGWVSTGDYPAGTLANEKMFSKENEFPTDTAEVGLVLSREQVVSKELGINDRIQIYSTSSDVGTAATSVGSGTIVDIARPGADGDQPVGGLSEGIHITVRVAQAELPQVAQAAGNGTAYVAVVAPEPTEPPADEQSGSEEKN
ncbi:MAG: hypothetical protein ACRDO1_14930 [Nocardioidaceae bacterium]